MKYRLHSLLPLFKTDYERCGIRSLSSKSLYRCPKLQNFGCSSNFRSNLLIPCMFARNILKMTHASQPVISINMPDNKERTFIMVKPDGVQRNLCGPIISRFEQKGFKLVAMKFVKPSQAHFEAHYADLKEKPFFGGLVKFMQSSPVLAMVWEGTNAAVEGRKLLGATKPSASAPGTIRGDFGMDIGRNICHGSDSNESAKKEIALWFPEGIVEWTPAAQPWIYE